MNINICNIHVHISLHCIPVPYISFPSVTEITSQHVTLLYYITAFHCTTLNYVALHSIDAPYTHDRQYMQSLYYTYGMHPCTHTYIHIQTDIHAYLLTYSHTYTHTHTCAHAYVRTYVHTLTYIIDIHWHNYTHWQTYIHIWTCMHACMHTYLHCLHTLPTYPTCIHYLHVQTSMHAHPPAYLPTCLREYLPIYLLPILSTYLST